MDDISKIAAMLTDDPDVINEDNWIQDAVDPDKAGMFDGVSLKSINSQIATLKKKNKKRKGSVPEADKTKMSQLIFAKRGKSKGGLTGDK